MALVLVVLAPATQSSTGSACTEEYVPAVGMACLRADGLYELVLADGTRLMTHGGDPMMPGVAVNPANGEVGFDEGSVTRQPPCATGPYLHVLYAYLGSMKDAKVPEIRDAVRRMNAVLNADGLESGQVTTDYNVLCDEVGDIRVDAFQGPSNSDYDAVAEAARSAGFVTPGADYLIFYEGSSTAVCGVANMWYDETPSASNKNVVETGYAVAYNSCWFDLTPMHENAHNQGAVQLLAPFSDLNGHCLEGYDVMCYTSSFVPLCTDRIHFDCHFDTYFDAAPESGEYLASNWNIGSRANPLLSFGLGERPSTWVPAPPQEANPEPPSAWDGNATAPQPTPEGSDPPASSGQPAPEPTQQPPEGPRQPTPSQAIVRATAAPAPGDARPKAQPAFAPSLAAVGLLVLCAALLRRRL